MNLKRSTKLVLTTLLLLFCMAVTVLAEGEYGPGYSGWHQAENGRWEYLESGARAKSAWKTIDGVSCYFDEQGYWVEDATPEGTGAQAATPQTQPQSEAGQAADAAALASGTVSAEYAARANPFPDHPDVVEVDIANQHVFCYKNNVLMWDSYCVTGCTADGHNTPEGVFAIQSKEQSRYLLGPKDPATGKNKWKNWVDYWMPFHDGCGLHDASWRQKFAGTIYQYAGSHGCVNLPVNKTPGLFHLVYVGMPVIVHP